MRTRVGLIGYGRFGRLAARYMAAGAEVCVFDPRAHVRAGHNLRRVPLGEAAAQKVVVLAVPISSLRSLLQLIRSYVLPGAVVIDVCSVKVVPMRWMQRMLPRTVGIVGMHPLFGPDSDTGTLRGQRLVVCPARRGSASMDAIRRLARSRGVRLSVMSPQQHDKLMAETLLLTQYVGRLLVAAGVRQRGWSTPAYRHLVPLLEIARNDSEQLFADMWRYNPYGRRVASALDRSHGRLRKLLGKAVDY